MQKCYVDVRILYAARKHASHRGRPAHSEAVVQEVALDEECDEPDGQVLSHRDFEEEPKGPTWMHSAEALAEGLAEAKSTGHDVAELTSTAGRCNKKLVDLLVEALRSHPQNQSQASSLAAATPPTKYL